MTFAFARIGAVVSTRVEDYFPKDSMRFTRERYYEIEDSLSYLGVAHGGESAAQLKTLARDERVGATWLRLLARAESQMRPVIGETSSKK
jgi:hypothetical protein